MLRLTPSKEAVFIQDGNGVDEKQSSFEYDSQLKHGRQRTSSADD
jgi:hypothetical protein